MHLNCYRTEDAWPRSRLPRKHHWLWQALQKAPVILLLVSSAVDSEAGKLPTFLPPDRTEKSSTLQIFCWDGLVAFSHRFYAASSAGLVEVNGGSFSGLYSWGEESSGIAGLWSDKANGLLWVSLSDRTLCQFDGRKWRTVKFPKPAHGYFSRQDMWRGFQGVSNTKAFWLTGAGRAWIWDAQSPGKWSEQVLPAIFGPERIPGPLLRNVIPTEDCLFLIKRDQNEPIVVMEPLTALVGEYEPIGGDTAYLLSQSSCQALTNTAERFFTMQATVANSFGYIRAKSGNILQVGRSGVSKVQCPGYCEAVTTSGGGALLASFRGQGIFELRTRWQKLLPSPHPDAGQPHEIYLAAQGAELALAVKPIPNFRTGVAKGHYSVHDQLWLSDGKSGWRAISFRRLNPQAGRTSTSKD